MTEANVVYSDVTFLKSNGNVTAAASSPTDTTYSDIRILKTKPSAELPGSQQQPESNGRSKVTPERVAIAALSALLAAAVAGLIFTSYKNIQSVERLQQLTAVNKNLSEKGCEGKPSPPDEETCPDFFDFLSTMTCPKCQEGWEQHGKQCYYFSNDISPWEKARETCQSQGGDLVQIDSRHEQSFLVREISGKMKTDSDKFWIGLTDSMEEGTWLWVDGSPLNKSLRFWSFNEPDDWKDENRDGEDCVRMGEKEEPKKWKCWFDKSCKSCQRRVCEKPAQNTGSLYCS